MPVDILASVAEIQLAVVRTRPIRAGKIACNFTDARSEAGLIRQAMGCGYDVVGQSNGGEEVLRQGQPGRGRRRTSNWAGTSNSRLNKA